MARLRGPSLEGRPQHLIWVMPAKGTSEPDAAGSPAAFFMLPSGQVSHAHDDPGECRGAEPRSLPSSEAKGRGSGEPVLSLSKDVPQLLLPSLGGRVGTMTSRIEPWEVGA